MKKEIIDYGHGRIEVTKDDNLIYFKVYGEFTDADVLITTEYMESFFAEIGGPTIRIWDGTNINSDQFKITTKGTDQFVSWADSIKKKWPGNQAYFISDKPIIFGVSRMYELKAADNNMPMTVVKTFDELPDEIKDRILQKTES